MGDKGNGSENIDYSKSFFHDGPVDVEKVLAEQTRPKKYKKEDDPRSTNPPDRPVLTQRERAFASYLTAQVNDCRGCKVPESVTAEDLSHAVITVKGIGKGKFKAGVDVVSENTKESVSFFATAKSVTKKVLTAVLIAGVLGALGWLVIGAKISLRGGG